ncbi:MAG: hypothetical protein ACJ74Z_23485 [Bryobacteraceae bacterium]
MKKEDVSRVLMAIAVMEGIWDREMRIPDRSRILLVEQHEHHWKLDERGYPIPSQALLDEIQRLEDREGLPS